jgi:HEAT repeat protein
VPCAWRAILLLIFLCSPNLLFAQKDIQENVQEQAWQVLTGGLEDNRASDRAVAVQALSLLPANRRATGFAISALQDKNVRVRAAAAVALGQQRARSAVPALKNALNDPEISVVLAAAHSLLLLKDQSAYQIYYAVLMGDRKSNVGLFQSQLDRVKDPRELAKIGFAEGIGFVPFGGMGYEAYRTIRKNDSAPVRTAAARFLAEDPDPVSEDALIQTALADKDELVRLAALDALTQRGHPNCIKRLTRNLSDEKPAVRYRTAAVILHLSASRKKPHKP